MTVDPRLAQMRRDALQAFRPPAKLALADWIQASVFLPSSRAVCAFGNPKSKLPTPSETTLWSAFPS